MNRKTPRGFTLIELLVVIAIIAILAAILFPVFAKARDRAQATTCINNQKQIGIALTTYTQDNNETFPPTRGFHTGGFVNGTWKDAIAPYLRNTQVYVCPSNVYAWAKGTGAYNKAGDETGRWPRSYATNGAVFLNGTESIAINKFKNPSGTILICESRYPYPNQFSSGATTPWEINMTRPEFMRADPNKGAFQTHGGGRSNFIFADTHVQALPVSRTYSPQNMWQLNQDDKTAQATYDNWAKSNSLLKEYR